MPAVPGLPPGPPLPRAGERMARFDMIVRDRQPGTDEWSPFGGGSRRCLGASFALMEMRGVIRDVLSTTELEPARADRVQEFNEKTWVDQLRQDEYGSAYKPSDRDLKAAWEKLGRRLHLRYMLVASMPEANEIRSALEQGAVFAKIAEQRSQDPESRAQGGDIGFVSYLDLDPLSRDAARGQ